MSTESERNATGEGQRSRAIDSAWQQLRTESKTEIAPELLAAYAEGNLHDEEREAVESHLSRSPDDLAIVHELHECLVSKDDLPRRFVLRSFFTTDRTIRRSIAASLLIITFALGWGVAWLTRSDERPRRVARLEAALTDTKIQLAAAYKEIFFAATPKQVRAFWAGNTTAQTLQLPILAGPGTPTSQALTYAERARDILLTLADDHKTRGASLVDLATLDIVEGKLEEARGKLRQARNLLGDAPEVKNARAVLLFAQRDNATLIEAENLLRQIKKESPEYLPATFNLALLLQFASRDAESRRVWHEYLKREKRPEYQQAAKDRLAAMRP